MRSPLSPSTQATLASHHVGPDTRRVSGLHLRYLLTDLLCRGGVWSPSGLARELRAAGFELGLHPAKTVADALRWECRRDRVRHVGRGRYQVGYIPATTRRRLRQTARDRRILLPDDLRLPHPAFPSADMPSADMPSPDMPGPDVPDHDMDRPWPPTVPAVSDEAALTARKCWRTLEPYHGFIYFAAEAAEEYTAIGLDGMSGYFLSRAAAMGRPSAALVEATFYNFHPAYVADAMAAVPRDLDAATVLDARLRAVDRGLRARLDAADLTSPAMARAADLAVRAAQRIGTADAPAAGRPLGLAHARLPLPDGDHLRLWWAITALREYRGDGHIAMLIEAELSGVEALVLHGASGAVPPAILRKTRAWSELEWSTAVDGLAERGLLAADGTITDQGAARRDGIDARTDELAAPAWGALTPSEADELRSLVRPWSSTIQSGMFA